jgi:hypothetical protein
MFSRDGGMDMKSNRTTESMALKATLVILAFSPCMVSTPSFAADDCEFCDRGAVVSKCENPDLPANWEELYEPYWECMDRELPKDDPNVTMSQEPDAFASQRCEHLHPRIDFTTARSIATRIAEIHTTACFHLIGRDIVEQYRAHGEGEGWSELIKPPGYKIPEYAFEVVFDAVTEEIVDGEGKPGSSLEIDLYYDGDERIHVNSWKTTSPTYTVTSNTNRMFKNDGALMRQVAPLQNLLWEFEQTPTKCQITPEEISVRENETTEINLTGFTGKTGPSKSFNRIVVTVDKGEILNGEPLESDPDARVFKIGDGNVSVTYAAPGSCGIEGDTIHVYNSCDIAKTSLIPLSQTKQRDEIASKRITCPASVWTGTANLTLTVRLDCEQSGPEGPYKEREFRQHDRSSEKATMKVRCSDIELADNPIVVKTGGTDLFVSGTHRRSIDESTFSERRGSAGWHNNLQTLQGNASCEVSPDALSLSFRKAEMASADEMRRLMEEMREATNDQDRYEELSAQLDALLNPANDDASTPLKGIVQYFLDCPIDAKLRKVIKKYRESKGVVETTEEEAELEIAFVGWTGEFEATYLRGTEGDDRIEAIYTTTIPPSPSAGSSSDCPQEILTFTFNLILNREPDD